LFLKYKTGLFSDATRLLHFAPEPALENILKKQNNINYLTADLYQEEVMEKIDITSIPYPDQSFNAILCNHVLEHIPDDNKAMRELYRVLSAGGWAVLQVPVSKVLETTEEDPAVISEAERERKFGHRDHVRIYGRDYPDRLRQAGFKVEEFSWLTDEGPEFRDPNLNLNKDEVVFFCTK
jgi:SAM-dependent methyltransferase